MAFIASKTTALSRRLAKFGAINLKDDLETAQVEKFQKTKADLRDEISNLQADIDTLKVKRKTVEQHVMIKNLPEDQKFSRLSTQTKHLVDTIKMIAYRAETAMANVIREKMPQTKTDEARSLLKSISTTAVDLIPTDQMLTVRIHHQAHHCSDEIVEYLCSILNETNAIFPGTTLRVQYELVSNQNPRGQEV